MDVIRDRPYAIALAAVGIPTIIFAKRAIRSFMMRTFTAVPDLVNIGKPRKGGKIDGTAVVCGGSIAGLMAARVLADHYTRVVVIEADDYTFTADARSADPEPFQTREVADSETGQVYQARVNKRARVWQYFAMHIYQALLTRFMRVAFPNYDERARKAGIIFGVADFNTHFLGRRLNVPWHRVEGRQYEVMFSSRRAFEATLRDLVVESWSIDKTEGNVQFFKGTVTAYNVDVANATIKSVSYRDSNGATQLVQSDIVVDCTGNAQAGLKFLARALERPDLSELRQEYHPKMFYQTWEIPIPEGFRAKLAETINIYTKKPVAQDYPFAWIPDPKVDYHVMLLGGIERDRICYALGGHNSYLPTTWETSIQFAKEAKNAPPFIVEWLEFLGQNQDQATLFQSRFTSCSRVFYEKAADILPRNFIATGDATLRLNPRLGDGCTKSAIGAITLDAVLRQHPPTNPKFGRTFFARMATRTGGLWDASRWLDYGAEGTLPCKGETNKTGQWFRTYYENLTAVASGNQDIAYVFWHGAMFLTPGADVFTTPSILFRVLWRAMWVKK